MCWKQQVWNKPRSKQVYSTIKPGEVSSKCFNPHEGANENIELTGIVAGVLRNVVHWLYISVNLQACYICNSNKYS